MTVCTLLGLFCPKLAIVITAFWSTATPIMAVDRKQLLGTAKICGACFFVTTPWTLLGVLVLPLVL